MSMHPNNPRPILGRHVRNSAGCCTNLVYFGGLLLGTAAWALALIELWRIVTTHWL